MNNPSTQELLRDSSLPQDLHLLYEPGYAHPDDPDRPNRVCICLSDLHFTDGTVGNQSADAVVWENVFEAIMDICVNEEAEELYLILAGDVVDMIRSSRWIENNKFPWDRESDEYRTDPGFKSGFEDVLVKIMDGIVERHAQPPAPGQKGGFFYLLQRLPEALKEYDYRNSVTGAHKTSKVRRVRTLALLGNHDKEVLVSDKVLKTFYEKCLGQPLASASPNGVSEDYRRWIGKMYFDDERRFLDPEGEQAPWTPFYWCDRGFRLFVTHGHWRDPENNRSIRGNTADTSWSNPDGWNLKRWQNMEFSPFTRPCWGDTIVAAMLAGFMYSCKNRLDEIERQLKQGGNWGAEDEKLFNTLRRVLDEMDLYRPTAAATKRLLQLTRELRTKGLGADLVRRAIEKELFDNLHAWINLKFNWTSATPKVRRIVWFGKIALNILNFFNRPFFNRANKAGAIDLEFAYRLVSKIDEFQQGQREDPSPEEMRLFTAFLEDYRAYGFRLHCEGHTHTALQEDLYFDEPATPDNRKNYTYVNFGAWRDQVKPTQNNKYRRFGIGRALVVLDKTEATLDKNELMPGKTAKPNRQFMYYAQDITSWSDGADAWDGRP